MNTKASWGEYRLGPGSHRLNESYREDRVFWAYEISATRAWAEALEGAGILSPAELEEIKGALDGLGPEPPRGDWEDVHTCLEDLLTQRTGAGKKIHTARSRNEQVVVDEMLWCRDARARLTEDTLALLENMMSLAKRSMGAVVPGRTHALPAQPLLAAHVVLAHMWPLLRDIRLADALERLYGNRCPLGSGALAGAFLPVERRAVARSLGFEAPSENSLDAVSSRDYVLGHLFLLSTISTHLSRLAGEWIAGVREGWLRMGPGASTSSSLMPHKRNPDVAELLRATSPLVQADLLAALGTISGLESGYHKDLQNLKSLMFRSQERVMTALAAAREMVRESVFVQVDLDSSLSSTSRVKQLVEGGMAFRDAYFKVKNEDPGAWPPPRHAVEDFDVEGGTAPARVQEALERMAEILEGLR